MSLAIVSTRYNWMGYHGTQSEEAALLRWTGKQEGTLDYNSRQDILEELEMRLFLIKLELGLLSPEEIEEMERRRREAARLEAERLERERLLREERLAAERRALEDEESLARAALEHELLYEIDSMDQALEHCLRAGVTLFGNKETGCPAFSRAVRSYLVAKDTGFVSYLDGSYHMTLNSLDNYNSSKRNEVAEQLVGSRIQLAMAEQFSTATLHNLVDMKNMLRMKLDAAKCKEDEEFVRRIRMNERQDNRTPRMVVESNETESSLSGQLDRAMEELKKSRHSYNTAAAAAAHPVIVAIASRDRLYSSHAAASSAPAEEPRAIEESHAAPANEPEQEEHSSSVPEDVHATHSYVESEDAQG